MNIYHEIKIHLNIHQHVVQGKEETEFQVEDFGEEEGGGGGDEEEISNKSIMIMLMTVLQLIIIFAAASCRGEIPRGKGHSRD